MTDAAYHALQVKAARNARRYLRSLKTAESVVERQLDRLIAGKEIIRTHAYDELARQWSVVKQNVSATEKAMADAIVQF
jgi:hypothetical protein